jgi:TrkA domain protein
MVTLNDTEARQVAGIIGGMSYTPKALESASITLENLVIEWYKVEAHSQAIGKTIGQLQVRQMTGATLMAIIEKDGRKLINPGPNQMLSEDATLVVAGERQQIQAFKRLIAHGSP